MLSFPANVRLHVATSPVDFRKSFDGLAAVVQNHLLFEPTCGDIFVFLNRRANQIRLLFWDRDGYWLFAKRLEAGTFKRTKSDDDALVVEVSSAELMLILTGIDATGLRKRKRFSRT